MTKVVTGGENVKLMMLGIAVLPKVKLFLFDSLPPGQQFFSHIGAGLPGLNQYYAGIIVLCSRT